ncbi:MAG TPA: A/G-specific adenine glycosylase [Casimicrobiaceae bacterium]|nr:A/G-specific adenine glycosylase [Casimicrobiaceae bacterium]
MSDTVTASFASRVVRWQRAHGRRDLPWQQSRDAYRIWLSEIMLQQTQVATVLRYYERIVDAFPDVAALAAAPVGRVLELWSGLGYYRRAHHLHAAAREVVERFDGCFPTDSSTLATLPGIGRSTAAAIAAFASQERCAILDGNVKRVVARHRGIDGWPGTPRVEAMLWREAENMLPLRGDIAAYTQGMMDLGATICARTKPLCATCPVANDCVARVQGWVNRLPTPRPKKVLPRREIVVLLIEHENRVLLERRPPTGVWPGLLSLPEASVDDEIASVMELRFGATAYTSEPLASLTHVFTHFALEMRPVRVVLKARPSYVAMASHEWIPLDAVMDRALPSPVRGVFRQRRAASRY